MQIEVLNNQIVRKPLCKACGATWSFLYLFCQFLATFYIDGMVMEGWMGGQAKSKKIMYFQHFCKTIWYFFLVVSRPLRKIFKKFSEKNSKKIKKIKFVKKFRTTYFFQRFFRFFIKKVYFSKITRYFFLVVSLPPRRVLKTFSEKKSKKK